MPVQSIEIPLGTTLPPFALRDPFGKQHSSDTMSGPKGLLVVFTCNHCPYAKAVWPRIISLAQYAKPKGVNTVGINPNIHPDYPEDAPEVMKDRIREWNISFPYLVDESQDVARTYKAQCTPDIYLFDGKKKLVYHGRVDDNWQEPSKVTRHELKEAIDQVIAGSQISGKQFPSIGCSIKFRNGEE